MADDPYLNAATPKPALEELPDLEAKPVNTVAKHTGRPRKAAKKKPLVKESILPPLPEPARKLDL